MWSSPRRLNSSLPSSAPVCTWPQCCSRASTCGHHGHAFYHTARSPWKQLWDAQGKRPCVRVSCCARRREAVIPGLTALNTSLPGKVPMAQRPERKGLNPHCCNPSSGEPTGEKASWVGFVVWPTSGGGPTFADPAEASFTALEGLCPVWPSAAQQQAALGGSVLFTVSGFYVLQSYRIRII